jgi:methionine-S-sulfoxide reductase
VEGVIRTRVGYTGGEKPSPTYRSLGDHTESIQIDFDPSLVSYEKLMDIFWQSHDPSDRAWSRQYRNALFYHNEDQRRAAEKSKERIEAQTGEKVRTEILPASTFYPAEDYHQKFNLQRDSALTAEYDAIYPDPKDFVNSTAVARVNGYVSGYGTYAQLEREIEGLGLSEESRRRLADLVRQRGR